MQNHPLSQSVRDQQRINHANAAREGIERLVRGLYAGVPNGDDIIRHTNDILSICLERFLREGERPIKRTIKKIKVPYVNEDVELPLIPVDSAFAPYFQDLGITLINGSGQAYVKGPLWNALGRLVWLPLVISRYRALLTSRLNPNLAERFQQRSSQQGQSNEEPRDLVRKMEQRLASSSQLQLSYNYHVGSDPPILLSHAYRNYIQIFNKVLSLLGRESEDGSGWFLNESIVSEMASILFDLRALEHDHIGLTNTDRYLLFSSLLLTNEEVFITATTADLFGHWSLNRSGCEGDITKNPMLPLYFELIRLHERVKSGSVHYLMSRDACFSSIQAMSEEDLRIAKFHVHQLEENGVVLRIGNIDENLLNVSIISGNAVGFTYRGPSPGEVVPDFFAFVRMQSSTAIKLRATYESAFSQATPLSEKLMQEKWNELHSR